MSEILLKGIGIRKYFPIKGGVSGRTLGYVHAVDDVNITIYKGNCRRYREDQIQLIVISRVVLDEHQVE